VINWLTFYVAHGASLLSVLVWLWLTEDKLSFDVKLVKFKLESSSCSVHRLPVDSEDKWQCAVRSQQINLVRGCSQQQLQVYVIFYRLQSRHSSPPLHHFTIHCPFISCNLSHWLTDLWMACGSFGWAGCSAPFLFCSVLLCFDKSVCISNWIHERALDTSIRTFISLPFASFPLLIRRNVLCAVEGENKRERGKSLALVLTLNFVSKKESHKILISTKSEGKASAFCIINYSSHSPRPRPRIPQPAARPPLTAARLHLIWFLVVLNSCCIPPNLCLWLRLSGLSSECSG